MKPPPGWFEKQQAADELGVSLRTLDRFVKSGFVRKVAFNRRVVWFDVANCRELAAKVANCRELPIAMKPANDAT
jgi:predicted site-specific integrase-resolvase